MAATTDYCAICVIDGKLMPSIAWEGAPICRECLADTMSKRADLPMCPLSGPRSREPHPASPSPGISCSTLQ
jgi:hypothetical protein